MINRHAQAEEISFGPANVLSESASISELQKSCQHLFSSLTICSRYNAILFLFANFRSLELSSFILANFRSPYSITLCVGDFLVTPPRSNSLSKIKTHITRKLEVKSAHNGEPKKFLLAGVKDECHVKAGV